jgi:hypothetical protein
MEEARWRIGRLAGLRSWQPLLACSPSWHSLLGAVAFAFSMSIDHCSNDLDCVRMSCRIPIVLEQRAASALSREQTPHSLLLLDNEGAKIEQ